MADSDDIPITIRAEGSDALKSLEKLRRALQDIDKSDLGRVKRELAPWRS